MGRSQGERGAILRHNTEKYVLKNVRKCVDHME